MKTLRRIKYLLYVTFGLMMLVIVFLVLLFSVPYVPVTTIFRLILTFNLVFVLLFGGLISSLLYIQAVDNHSRIDELEQQVQGLLKAKT